MMFRVIPCMSPLEKVPFATFYPRWKYLCGTYISKKTFSSGLMYSILSIDATCFSTLLKGIIRRECQSFTNHGHAKTPPTVFNPLSLWLTLPRDMGVSHTQWPPSITRAILACLWFAQGLHRVCTGFAQGLYGVCTGFAQGLYRVCTGFVQGTKKSKQQSRSMMFRVILCIQFYRLTQLIFFQHYLASVKK